MYKVKTIFVLLQNKKQQKTTNLLLMETTENEEVQNLIQWMKANNIPHNPLPEDMPEEIKELVNSVLQCKLDWDEDENDTEELRELKADLKKQVLETIEVLKEYQNTLETRIEYTDEQKQLMALEGFYKLAESRGEIRVDGSFYMHPQKLLEIRLVTKLTDTGKIKLRNFTISRDFDEVNWVVRVK